MPTNAAPIPVTEMEGIRLIRLDTATGVEVETNISTMRHELGSELVDQDAALKSLLEEDEALGVTGVYLLRAAC